MDENLNNWVDRLSMLLLVAMLVSGALCYGDLPDRIPIHFNGRGEADGFGPKSMIWSIPAIAFFIYIFNKYLMSFMKSKSYDFQRKWSSGYKGKSDAFIKRSNEYNAVQMTYLNLLLVLIFVYIFYGTIHAALNNTNSLSGWVLWLLVALIFIPTMKMVFFSLRKED